MTRLLLPAVSDVLKLRGNKVKLLEVKYQAGLCREGSTLSHSNAEKPRFLSDRKTPSEKCPTSNWNPV